MSEVLNDNKTKRFDSEYFKKEFLKIDKNIISSDYNRLVSLCEKITDFGAFSQNNFIEYKKNGSHYFIRNQDIENSFIKDDKIFIEQDVYEKLSLKLNEFDLLLQRTGSIGKSGLVLKKDLPSSANQNLAQIKPNLTKINPYFLNVFLNSLIGQKTFERLATGNVQPWLNLGQIESVKIPSLSEKFQLKIEEIVKSLFSKTQNSKTLYTQAENILLEEIGLQNFTPSKEPVNIKSFTDSFATSGRLDAEYYQKKYDIIEGFIKSYKNGFSTLGQSIEYLKTGEYSSSYIKKNSSNNYYLRNTNISNGKITPDDNYAIDSNQFKTKACLNEILTSRVGTIGLFGVVNKEFVNSVYSDNVLCFKLRDNFTPLVYSILFSTEPYQLLLEKLAGGSVQPLITQTSLKLLPIPIIEFSKQKQIADLIEQSFSLKKQSEHLLEVAKKAVEIAIEENEEVAIKYINNQSNTNG